MLWILAILGLALLMVVHESGHLLAARAFGMRVTRFSIGFGPAIWRYRSSKSETVYQVALIPFLAYVQIDGMNPMEEIDPEDKGSYANASLIARISAIFAGPLANYLFASVLIFAALMAQGKPVPTTTVEVMPDTPAAAAQMQDNDKIIAINGKKIDDWEQMRDIIIAHPGEPLDITVKRAGKEVTLKVTPKPEAPGGGGLIGVQAVQGDTLPMPVKEAAVESIVYPARVVQLLVVSLARIITGQEKPQVTGPLGIVKHTKKAAEYSPGAYLKFLGMLSAYLGGFNLIPFPALDGGRLMFLGYEAVTRRRPDAKVEAHIHAAGLLLLLGLIIVVSFFDVQS